MLSEWTAECSLDAPTLVVPWTSDGEASGSSAGTAARFIDLRANPYDIAEIVEAEHNTTLARALRSLNATRSPFLTAKCDTWTLSATEQPDALEALRTELMLHEEDAQFGYASYIDLLWREQDRLDRIVRRAQRLAHAEAAMECILRPAFLDLTGPLEGFAVTFYLSAVGPEPEIARRRWELAMDDTVALLRSKELEAARGSATIDAADGYPLRVRHLGS
jgi:hypothetical protein